MGGLIRSAIPTFLALNTTVAMLKDSVGVRLEEIKMVCGVLV